MTQMKFTGAVRRVATVLTVGLLATPAFADFPEKPVTVLVGFGAGGGADTLARLIGKEAEAALGQPVVIENVPGGGGVVAATKLMNATPDGYTIGMAVTSTFSYAPLASDTVKFDADTFDYLTSAAALQNAVVVGKDSPFNTWEDVVAAGKSGQKVSFGSSSPAVNLMMNYISAHDGYEMKVVPTKGGAEIMKDVMGGHMDMGWSAGIHQRFGDDVKVLAAAGNERLVNSPDVPTFRDLGYDVGDDTYFLFFAPKGIPDEVFQALHDAFSAGAQKPEVVSMVESKMGFPSKVLMPDQLRENVAASTAIYEKLIAAAGN
ncbi:Bug family tripartite tricarboxylate transporter substrate binding protein [Oceanicola sp. S124]|uniref:Bug family tripartite tricarboxylate transporter substrate binding protein n=1 Tax=Oceanicola sp. S124 TaxID=1042378 RepID=UPI0002558955|nr:tripartite tricarboxylate transporter substrate binding protein [Oceanicola sp. S124]